MLNLHSEEMYNFVAKSEFILIVDFNSFVDKAIETYCQARNLCWLNLFA